MSTAQVGQFLEQVGRAKFWQLLLEEEPPVSKDGSIQVRADGAEWILEGVENGRYHVVDRWSPEKGAFRETALMLVRFARLDLKVVY